MQLPLTTVVSNIAMDLKSVPPQHHHTSNKDIIVQDGGANINYFLFRQLTTGKGFDAKACSIENF